MQDLCLAWFFQALVYLAYLTLQPHTAMHCEQDALAFSYFLKQFSEGENYVFFKGVSLFIRL